MSETHNYCDAPHGQCLQAKRIAELEERNTLLMRALSYYAPSFVIDKIFPPSYDESKRDE